MSPRVNPPKGDLWYCVCGTSNEPWRSNCRNCKTPKPAGSLAPLVFPDTGQQLRTTTGADGNPWFVAADVAVILGYRDAHNVVRRLDADEKGTHALSTPGGRQDMTVISEAGLYAAVLGSQIITARAFKRWVTHDVLPAIRRTGHYAAAPTREIPESYAEALRAYADEVDARAAAEQRAAELEPAATAWSELAEADGDYSVRDAAQILCRAGIDTGQNRLFATMRDLGWLDSGGDPYQREVDNGRLVRRTLSYTHSRTKEPRLSSQVRVTAKGIDALRKRLTAGQLTLLEGGA